MADEPFPLLHGSMPGSLELAYLGDTVYDLYVRERLIVTGEKVRALHLRAVRLVCARAQAEAFARVQEMLTPQEADVARRARNAHQSPPRNADAAQYHRATAFEALIGYLYVTGQRERIREILDRAVVFEDT